MKNNNSDKSLQKIIKIRADHLLSPTLAEKYSHDLDKYVAKDSELAKSNIIPTGFNDIDEFMGGGFKRGSLYSINARPSIGKTSFITSIIKHLFPVHSPRIILFCPHEGTSKERNVDRLLSAYSGVDLWDIITGNLTDEDFEKIGPALGTLSEAQIFINERTHIDIDELIESATLESKHSALDLILIDDAHKLKGLEKKMKWYPDLSPRLTLEEMIEEARDPDDPYYGADQESMVKDFTSLIKMWDDQQTSYYFSDQDHVFNKLAKLAENLNVPVVCTSNASTVVEHRNPQIPTYDDITIDSLKLNAHTILGLYRESYYQPESRRGNTSDIFLHETGSSRKARIELNFNVKNSLFQNKTSN